MVRGACRGASNLFFEPIDVVIEDARKEEGKYQRIRAAKAVCDSCPVEQECLEWAIRVRLEYGIAGGLSWRQRKLLIRERQHEGTEANGNHRG